MDCNEQIEASTHAERVEKSRPAYPSLYSAVWPDLVPLARSLGYALTIHGSLSRDLDLIAVPWTEEAVEPEALVKAVADKFGAWVGSPDLGPVTRKPHGRMGAVIVLGGHAVVDLSIMPRSTPVTPAPQQAPPVGSVHLCPVCAREGPWGTWGPFGMVACVRCRDAGQHAAQQADHAPVQATVVLCEKHKGGT